MLNFVPYTSDILAHEILALEEQFPFVRVEVIGTSRLGKPLYALCIGHGSIFLGYNAAHHANEWITAPLLMQFLWEYCEKPKLDVFTLYAIPMVNPDGVNGVINHKYPSDWKANACGVDLNVNYPASWQLARENKFAQGFTQPGPRGYVGAVPLSEPESAAMAAYTRLRDFHFTLSLHTQGEEIYHQYRHFAPPGAKKIAAEMEKVSGYLCVDVPDESADGGYRDWFIETFNRPGFTIECGLGENPLPITDFPGIYERVRKILWVPFINPPAIIPAE